MSRFSGKCDVFDFMMMSCDDELKAFETFKKETKGVLHQHRKVTVTEINREWVAKHSHLTWNEETVVKTLKDGRTRKVTNTVYTYWGKDYPSLKKLNKKGVYVTIDIPFETIFDLIPYYSYVIAACGHSEGNSYIVLADESEPDSRFDEYLSRGFVEDPRFPSYYKTELQEHYLEVVKRYFSGKGLSDGGKG